MENVNEQIVENEFALQQQIQERFENPIGYIVEEAFSEGGGGAQAFLDDLKGEASVHQKTAGFIDLHEPCVIDDFTYKQLQFKKYGYAVINNNDKY